MNRWIESASVTAPKSELTDYYLWEEPDKNLRIFLNPKTVDRLQQAALQGIDSIPKGLEIGGILFGRTSSDSDGTITVIEDFELLPSQYRDGEVYTLSNEDEAYIKAALEHCQSIAGDKRSVMGYFRSHNRDGIFLSPDDISFIQTYLPGSSNVFLLIKPLPSRACTAGFFFWEEGRIQSEFTCMEVPLGPVRGSVAAVRAAARRSEKPSFSDVVTLTPASAPNGSIEAGIHLPAHSPAQNPSSSHTTHRWRARVAVGILLVIAAAVSAVILKPRWLRTLASSSETRSESQASPLGMHVQFVAGHCTVTWENKAVGLKASSGAVLSVRDGGTQRNFVLSRGELQSGAFSYTPISDELQFRLETYTDGKPGFAESIRVLLVGASSGDAAKARVPETPSVESAPAAAIKNSPEPARTPVSAARDVASVAPLSQPSHPDVTRFEVPRKSISADPSARKTAAVADEAETLEPPVLPADATSRVPVVLQAGTEPLSAPPSRPQEPPPASARVTVPVPPPPQRDQPAQPQASVGVGPRVIFQVNPRFPRDLRGRVTAPLQVDVEVKIDATGNVTDAKVLSTKGAMAGFVTKDAIESARRFRFAPARLNAQNVPSTAVLTFRFLP